MSPDKRVVRSPLHAQVTKLLRAEILARGRPGEKIESETQLAKRFGVSVLTMRHAVGALAHEGLIQRFQGKGTFVADLTEGKHVAILTLSGEHIPDASFQLRVFHGLSGALERHDWKHRHYFWRRGEQSVVCPEFVDDVARGRVAGAIFVAMYPDPALPLLQARKIPFVVSSDGTKPGAAIDFPGMVRDGTRHLIERGCRRIALIQWHDPGQQGNHTEDLFRTLLQENGLEVEPHWIRSGVLPDVPGAGWEEFREVWAARPEKPDGLLVLDDVLFRDVAIGILDSRIRVPDQLQVVAHANKGSGFRYPFPVTFLEIAPQEYVDTLADLLVEALRRTAVAPAVRFVTARLVPAANDLEPRALPTRG